MDVPETRYAKSGNIHVAYCIRGDGPVDLVYIPGWISNIELMWEDRWMRAWLDRMATFSRLIAFDKTRYRALRPSDGRSTPRS